MTTNIDQRVNVLEALSVEAMIEFLSDRTPKDAVITRARVAMGVFASVQRRRSAENQREALALMMQREGVVGHRELSASTSTVPSSSKKGRAA